MMGANVLSFIHKFDFLGKLKLEARDPIEMVINSLKHLSWLLSVNGIEVFVAGTFDL
jgi:hypothetical protein